ncbi:MAG: hypothetical protein K5924_12125 [Chloroflexi bacterium]|nr:hypothetical protein [Chloroflexota bacterium]
MSREERRQYERQMKSMERGVSLPPAARQRAERNAARRARRASAEGVPSPRRFWIRNGLVSLAAGFLAFSLQWPNMPFALYVGIAVTIVVAAVIFGIRLVVRRGQPRGAGPPRS